MVKFRKKISIAPGVKLNLSKSGVSGTFGVEGASVNVGENGAFLNTGIPGTGIYDRKKSGGGSQGGAEETQTGEVLADGDAQPMGKTSRRIFFTLFLISAGFCVAFLFVGHYFLAFFQGILAFSMLLIPILYSAKPADKSSET